MAQPLCVGFVGPVGAGKTPVAHYLSWNLGLPIFATDPIRSAVYEDTLKSHVDGEEYLAERDRQFAEVCGLGRSFILDASLDRTWEGVERQLTQAGFEVFLISFDLGVDFMRPRLEAKGYDRSLRHMEQNVAQHEAFLAAHGESVSLTINEANYGQRNQLCLQGVKRRLHG